MVARDFHLLLLFLPAEELEATSTLPSNPNSSRWRSRIVLATHLTSLTSPCSFTRFLCLNLKKKLLCNLHPECEQTVPHAKASVHLCIVVFLETQRSKRSSFKYPVCPPASPVGPPPAAGALMLDFRASSVEFSWGFLMCGGVTLI